MWLLLKLALEIWIQQARVILYLDVRWITGIWAARNPFKHMKKGVWSPIIEYWPIFAQRCYFDNQVEWPNQVTLLVGGGIRTQRFEPWSSQITMTYIESIYWYLWRPSLALGISRIGKMHNGMWKTNCPRLKTFPYYNPSPSTQLYRIYLYIYI